MILSSNLDRVDLIPSSAGRQSRRAFAAGPHPLPTASLLIWRNGSSYPSSAIVSERVEITARRPASLRPSRRARLPSPRSRAGRPMLACPSAAQATHVSSCGRMPIKDGRKRTHLVKRRCLPSLAATASSAAAVSASSSTIDSTFDLMRAGVTCAEGGGRQRVRTEERGRRRRRTRGSDAPTWGGQRCPFRRATRGRHRPGLC